MPQSEFEKTTFKRALGVFEVVALCLAENDEPDPNKNVADPDPYSLS